MNGRDTVLFVRGVLCILMAWMTF